MKKEETHYQEKERCDRREQRIQAKGRETKQRLSTMFLAPTP